MKQIISMAFIALMLISCGGNAKKADTANASETKTEIADPNTVNVYYFHGKQRCKTCVAVETVAKETVADAYAGNQLVKFIEVDISDKANNALAEKYEVSWNALIIAKGENSVDITDQGFATAVNNPETLTNLIKQEVNNRLN